MQTLKATFSYQGSNIQMISQEVIDMVPPSSDPLDKQGDLSGFWYELRDANNNPLYLRVIDNPIRFFVEVLSEDPEPVYTRQAVSQPEGSFDLLMPSLDQATTLALVSSPLDPEAPPTPASDIATFSLQANA